MQQQQSPAARNTITSSNTDLREVMRAKYTCSSVHELLLDSWAPKSCTKCETYRRKWVHYCQNNKISNPSYATYDQTMSFLAYLFHKESVVAVARASLPAILPLKKRKTLRICQKVNKMLKGI